MAAHSSNKQKKCMIKVQRFILGIKRKKENIDFEFSVKIISSKSRQLHGKSESLDLRTRSHIINEYGRQNVHVY